MKINQLAEEDLQDIGKYMFSVANGNHILNYSEMEYRPYLSKSPNAVVDMLALYYGSSNWGYDDPRMFEEYDVQWLTEKVDPSFKSSLDFNLPDFGYVKLQPYQQVIIDFTKALIHEVKDWSILLKTGTPIEQIYAVLACNMDVDVHNKDQIKNKVHVIHRGLEMYKNLLVKGYKVSRPFESWELMVL